MLNGMSVFAENGDVLSINIPEGTNGLLVTEITGLDPVPVSLTSAAYGQLDGVQHQSSRRDSREITFNIVLQKAYVTASIESRRQWLYRWFVPNQELVLQFDDSMIGSVQIRGRVETVEAPMFSEHPFVNVSIVCDKPDFVSIVKSEQIAFFDETLALEYEGTVPTGIDFEILKWMSASTNTQLTNRPGSGLAQTMIFPGSIPASNLLQLSTTPREKQIRLQMPNGPITSALARLSTDSKWISLFPGTNTFSATTQTAASTKQYRISYFTRYGGL